MPKKKGEAHNSWIRKKGHYYRTANNVSSLFMFFHLTAWSPGVCVGVRCLEWAPRMLLTQWVCMKAEETKLMKLYSYKGVQTICPTFASKRERDYIYYTGQQTEVPSVLEADTAVNCEWTLLRPFTIKSWEVSLTQKVTKKKVPLFARQGETGRPFFGMIYIISEVSFPWKIEIIHPWI